MLRLGAERLSGNWSSRHHARQSLRVGSGVRPISTLPEHRTPDTAKDDLHHKVPFGGVTTGDRGGGETDLTRRV